MLAMLFPRRRGFIVLRAVILRELFESLGKRMRKREQSFSDESPAKNIFECETCLRGLVGGLFPAQ
jgi:hypothetical protein